MEGIFTKFQWGFYGSENKWQKYFERPWDVDRHSHGTGAVVGLFLGKSAHMLAPIGDLFMQLIKMIVVPMVFFSLVGGRQRWENPKGLARSVS